MTPDPGISVRGVPVPVEVRPADEEQLGAVLRLAGENGLRVCVAGGGTKSDWGNPPRGLDLLVSTRDLRAHREIDAGNLSLIAGAGATITEARAEARAENRVLPLDPARPGSATVGGVTAAAEQGARGAAYGGVRDVVLGLRAVLADGSPVRFGGRTMKNVTGYDATRLFVGSFGILGVITEVTFRLLPSPEAERLAVVALGSLDQAGALAGSILSSYLQPLALQTLCATGPCRALAEAGLPPEGGPVLLAAFSGHPATVARSLRETRERARATGASVVAEMDAGPVLDAIADLEDPGPGAVPEENTALGIRAVTPPGRVWTLAAVLEAATQSAETHSRSHVGAVRGILDARLQVPPGWTPERTGSLVQQLRASAIAVGGHLWVTKGSGLLPEDFDPWGPAVSPLALMREVKARFDPLGVLNPGRFVGGI